MYNSDSNHSTELFLTTAGFRFVQTISKKKKRLFNSAAMNSEVIFQVFSIIAQFILNEYRSIIAFSSKNRKSDSDFLVYSLTSLRDIGGNGTLSPRPSKLSQLYHVLWPS